MDPCTVASLFQGADGLNWDGKVLGSVDNKFILCENVIDLDFYLFY